MLFANKAYIYSVCTSLGPDGGGVGVIGISILVVVFSAVLFLLVLMTSILGIISCRQVNKRVQGKNQDEPGNMGYS